MPADRPPPGASKKRRRKAASTNIASEMREHKSGNPRVKSPAQAIAIGLSEAGMDKKKPKRKRKVMTPVKGPDYPKRGQRASKNKDKAGNSYM